MGICDQRWSFLLLSVRLFLVVLARLHTGDTGELQLGVRHVLHYDSRCLYALVAVCTAHIRTTWH
jgi:hypothetical protein